jgi:hypothetical protein
MSWRQLGLGSIDEYTESKSVVIKAGHALGVYGTAVIDDRLDTSTITASGGKRRPPTPWAPT